MNLLEEMLRGLPEEGMQVEEVRMGPFLTAVRLAWMRTEIDELVPRSGLASTLAQHEQAERYGFDGAGKLESYTAQELAGYLLSDTPLRASIGMATVNAILEVPPQCFEGRSFMDLVLERCRGNRIAVLGHFPFVERLRKVSRDLHVLELRPIPGDLPAFRAREVLPTCQVVLLTATVLMNSTYREILPLCEAPFSVMLGPSTPASAVLFEHGIDVLAGSTVVEAERTLLEVSQGATYRDLSGVKKWVWEGVS